MQHFEPNCAGRKPMNCKAFPNLGNPLVGLKRAICDEFRELRHWVWPYLIYGTKLEHRGVKCYMWITADPAARETGERIGSAQSGPQGVFKAATGPPSSGCRPV